MKFSCLLAALVILAVGAAPAAFAQFDVLMPGETRPAVTDTDSVKTAPPRNPYDYAPETDATEDEAGAEEADSVKPALPAGLEERTTPAVKGDGGDSTAILSRAHAWVRRLIYRGRIDATHIGAYTLYQLTSWEEAVGSYGPIEARVGVYYLGTTEWMGKDAEWLQVVYQTLESAPEVIEYDLLVGANHDDNAIYRLLYRVDRGELQPLNLGLSPDQLDYDASDRPVEDGYAELDIYFGTFDTERFRGSGSGGSEVVLYRNPDVRPLGLVRLGYGDEALTLTDHGSDARPRFYVPPPPRTQ